MMTGMNSVDPDYGPYDPMAPDHPPRRGDSVTLGHLAQWERWATLLHWGLWLTTGVLAGAGAYTETWVFMAPAGVLVLLVIFMRYFLSKTAGRAETLREAFDVFLGRVDEREPDGSRRLRVWESISWVLVVPAIVFLNIWPWASLVCLVVLGIARFYIRQVRMEYGVRPGRYGTIAMITYVLLLLVALAATILRATGH